MNPPTLHRLLGGAAFALVLAGGLTARAQTVTIEAPTSSPLPTADSGLDLNAFDVDVSLDLPAGYYTDLQVVLTLPSGVPALDRRATASPTTGEFANGVYQAVTNTITWTQVAPIDLTAGAGVRRFRLEASFQRYLTRPSTPYDLAASVAGDVDTGSGAVPFSSADSHTTTATGPGASLAFYTGTSSFLPYGSKDMGYGMSGEATPRPGLFRRYSFSLGNPVHSPIDAGATWSIDLGDEFFFVGAGQETNFTGFSTSNLPTPWTKVGATIIGATMSAIRESRQVATAYVDVFVPCDDMAKSSAQATALAPGYASSASGTASATDWSGMTTTPLAVSGGNLGGPDLTVVCGGGGGLTKLHLTTEENGTELKWRITVAPPAGTPGIDDAMIVDVLPSGIVGVGGVGGINLEDFTIHYCNFDGVFSGHFDVTQFLAQLSHCRTTGYQAGDTHLVAYAARYENEGGPLGSVRLELSTHVTEAWSFANIGATVGNRAYFNGTTIYGALGDTAVESGNEDPWEHAISSAPVPGLDASYTASNVSGSPSPATVDANGGTGSVTVDVKHAAGQRYAINPRVEIVLPAGAIVSSVAVAQTGTCDTPYPAAAIPLAPYSDPVVIQLGDGGSPWESGPDGCYLRLRVNYALDATYPFIDRQDVPFTFITSADNDPTPSQLVVAPKALVTTGMDVQLAGSCWTDTVWGTSPPEQELILYEVTAVNRGSEDLANVELRFILPANAAYHIAFAGPDFPAMFPLQASSDGGNTWVSAPTGPDPSVTDVRVAGFGILGEGIDALRPTFYVAVKPDALSGLVTGEAWVETPSFGLGRTPIREASVDASLCDIPCECPDPTPDDACSSGTCDAQGACITVDEPDGTTCAGFGDMCVSSWTCQSGECSPDATVDCDDDDMCTSDSCDDQSGLCAFQPAFDCASSLPVYLPVSRAGQAVGAVACAVVDGTLTCDVDADDTLVLHADLGDACGSNASVP